MRKTLILFAALILILAPVFGAEEEKASEVKVKIGVGAWAASVNRYVGKISEYRPANDGVSPVAAAHVTGSSGSVYYDLKYRIIEETDDMRHELSLNASRVFNVKLKYDSFIHRLNNDPLTNMDVISEARSGVTHENFDPTKEYQITRREFAAESSFAIPVLEGCGGGIIGGFPGR